MSPFLVYDSLIYFFFCSFGKIYFMKKNLLVISSFIILFFNTLNSQVLITGDGNYSQNFDGLLNTGVVNTWSDNSTIENVYSQRTTSSVAYAANDGTNTTGGLYSYGTTASSERAIGTIGSANTSSGGNFAHGILLKNTSGLIISDLKVSYTLEQWRKGGDTTANTITFWYKISSTTITALTPGANAGWTAVTVLNTNSQINTNTAGALNGNNTENRVSLTNVQIPSLNIPNGAFIMLRWLDINHTGSDHGLAIDDVNLTWTIPCSNPSTFYQDFDNDGFGNSDVTQSDCNPISGYVLDNSDCNDNNPNAYPGAFEVLDNSIDENCDGVDGILNLVDILNFEPDIIPNPSNGAFIIRFNTSVNDGILNLTDINGKLILSKQITGLSYEINDITLKKGIYFLSIKSSIASTNKRVIIN